MKAVGKILTVFSLGLVATCLSAPAVSHNQVNTNVHYPRGTVFEAKNFNVVKDVQDIRDALKDSNTKKIIEIVAHRSGAQRVQIRDKYKGTFGVDLMDKLAEKYSGNFEDTLLSLMMDLPKFYAKELHDAIKGIGTDEDALIEILATLSNQGVQTVAAYYQKLYNKKLEDDIKGDTSSQLRRILVSLSTGNRQTDQMVDKRAASQDAKALYDAGPAQWGTDKSTFNAILMSRSYAQLRLIFEEYKKLSNKDIEETIKSEFSSSAKNGYLTVVRCVKDKTEVFAKRLHKAMAGFGTDDKTLRRIIVTRSEIDLGNIKDTYQRLYNKPLIDDIKGDTSGNYRDLLTALVI